MTDEILKTVTSIEFSTVKNLQELENAGRVGQGFKAVFLAARWDKKIHLFLIYLLIFWHLFHNKTFSIFQAIFEDLRYTSFVVFGYYWSCWSRISGVLATAGKLNSINDMRLTNIDVSSVPIDIINNLTRRVESRITLNGVKGWRCSMLENVKCSSLCIMNSTLLPSQANQPIRLQYSARYFLLPCIFMMISWEN